MDHIKPEFDLDNELTTNSYNIAIKIARDFVADKYNEEKSLEYRDIQEALSCFEDAIKQTNSTICEFDNLRVKRWFKTIAITTYVRFLKFAFLDFSNDLSRGIPGKEAADKNNIKFLKMRNILENITQAI